MTRCLARCIGNTISSCVRRLLAVTVLVFPLLFVEGKAAQATEHLQLSQQASPPVGATNLCVEYPWACLASSTGTDISLGTVKQVNRFINSSIKQIEDSDQYATAEKWALPTRKGGDCEDIALLKKYELIRLGVAANQLLLATVLDRQMRPHAVLVFKSREGDLVLDSADNRVVDWKDTGYSFLRVQDDSDPQFWRAVLKGGSFNAQQEVSGQTASIVSNWKLRDLESEQKKTRR